MYEVKGGRLKPKVRRQCGYDREGQIFSVTQPVMYLFASHVSCKVKYFGKVANG